jgi:short-subunit dehydrogenase
MDGTGDAFAVITGASQGLGRALADEIAGRRKNVALVSLRGTGLPEVKRMLDLRTACVSRR